MPNRGDQAPSSSRGATAGSLDLHAAPVVPGTQVINYYPNHPPCYLQALIMASNTGMFNSRPAASICYATTLLYNY